MGHYGTAYDEESSVNAKPSRHDSDDSIFILPSDHPPSINFLLEPGEVMPKMNPAQIAALADIMIETAKQKGYKKLKETHIRSYIKYHDIHMSELGIAYLRRQLNKQGWY